jgi:hypothetical protein
VSEQNNLITIKSMDIIPVFRIDLAESWVSAEPMVQNKSAEPGSPISSSALTEKIKYRFFRNTTLYRSATAALPN